jgi:DNA-directed RNA polymerase II subunit RPB1
MLFTKKDNFMSIDTIMNLIMMLEGQQAEFAMNCLPMPAIIKPKPLWSGKQIMSLIIPNINMKWRKGGKQRKSYINGVKQHTNYAPLND